MKDFLGELNVLFSYPKNIILLFVRLVLAYGFALPALLKINDIEGTIGWFADLSIPYPTVFAYVVSGSESIGIVLLILGLFTRFITFLLGCVMIGAILYVHIPHGFFASHGGLEIPLYYLIFLMILATHGSGKYSLDRILMEKVNNE